MIVEKNQDIEQKVDGLLIEMFDKLSKQVLDSQLVKIVEDILNFLFVLRSQGEK